MAVDTVARKHELDLQSTISSRVIPFHCGGSLMLSADLNVMELTIADRAFLNTLLEHVESFQAEVEREKLRIQKREQKSNGAA